MERDKDESLRGAQKFRTFSEIIANTAIVAASVRYYLNMVTKAAWRVEPADETAEAEAKAEWLEDVIYDLRRSWRDVVARAAMFSFYGFVVMEWVGKRRDDGTIGFDDVASRPQYTIEQWDLDEAGYVQGVLQRSPMLAKTAYLPRGKIVYIKDDALNDSPEGLGLLRHVIPHAKRLETYEKLENIGFRVDLRGVPIAMVPLQDLDEAVKDEAISAEDRDKLIATFQNFLEQHEKSPDRGLIIDSAVYQATDDAETPTGQRKWGIDLLKGSNQGQKEIAAAIERKTREIARILGTEHLLLGSDAKGSYALAENKTQSFGLIVDSALKAIAEAFDKDLIDTLWKLNGFDDAVKPWFKTESIQYRDVADITGMLRDLAQAGVPLSRADEAVAEVFDLLGLTSPKEEDESGMDDLDSSLLGDGGEEDETDDPADDKGDPNEVKEGGEEDDDTPNGGTPSSAKPKQKTPVRKRDPRTGKFVKG